MFQDGLSSQDDDSFLAPAGLLQTKWEFCVRIQFDLQQAQSKAMVS